MICSNGHARITFTDGDCPLCTERATRADLDGWNDLRDQLVNAMESGGTPAPAAPSVTLGVVIPHRDRREHLKACLASLDAQTEPADMVIVADDSREAKLYNWPWNKSRLVNGVLSEFPTDEITHVLLLDADIILHPDALRRIRVWLKTHSAVAVAPLDTDFAGTIMNPAGASPEATATQRFDYAASLARPRGPRQVGGIVAYPLDWLLQTGGMDGDFVGKGYHDLDLWERAKLDLYETLYVPGSEKLALHQRHPVEVDEEQLDRNRQRFEARWSSGGIVRDTGRPPITLTGGEQILSSDLVQIGGGKTAKIVKAREAMEALAHATIGHALHVTDEIAAGRFPTVGKPPVTCSEAGPGQSAFIDGLRSLGFIAVDSAEATRRSAAGERMLYHGNWPRSPGSKPVVLWHSGLTGSDLMGEGAGLATVLNGAREGKLDLLWLERRDVLPEGARYMTPVWSPESLEALADGAGPEVPWRVVVGLGGAYPSAAKNILAAVVGCSRLGAELHMSESAFEGERGPALRAALAGEDVMLHQLMERREVARLLASSALLVHPSTSDTWPYLVLESVYAGTPVVGCDTIAWMDSLPEWAQRLCIVRPATSSSEVRRLVMALLDDNELRARLLVVQRQLLDGLAPAYQALAADTLRGLGFNIPDGDPNDDDTLVDDHDATMVPAGPSMVDRILSYRRDLSDELTVFVISSGEPSLTSCLDHLGVQDCVHRLEQIANVAPMEVAFQQMLDLCTTPYYVQVDADMLLEPWAISGLYDAIKAREAEMNTPPHSPQSFGFEGIAQVVAWLWDDDFGRPIQGVKIYSHAICSRFPYASEVSCEMGQNEALKSAGYQVLGMQLGDQDLGGGKWQRTRRTFGRHFASQTPAMAYERYQRLCQKHRLLPWMGWIAPYIKQFEAEFVANPTNEIARAKYLGAMAGMTGPLPEGERDYRSPNQDYRRMAAYLGKYSEGPRELTIYLTDKCNFSCVFGSTPCKRQTEDGVEAGGTMTPATLRAILTRYPSIKSVCVAGFGEPFLHPDLPGLFQIMRSRNVTAGIITNGSALGKRIGMLRQFGSTLSYVSVSLNAATWREHEAMSGVKLWNTVLEGIGAARAAGLRCGVSYVVTRSNVVNLPVFLALCLDLNVSFVHLHNPLPHNGIDDAFRRDVLQIGDAEFIGHLAIARGAAGADLVEVWPEPIDLDSPPPGRCMSPFVSIGVDAKGSITGCRRVDPPEPAFGGYAWAWRGGHMTGLIAQITGDRDDAHPACKGCFGNARG